MQQECNLPVTEHTLILLGILTKDKIRKYSLKYTNLQALLKIYAVSTYQPFNYYIFNKGNIETPYYVTDYGLQWLYSFFEGKSLRYARSIISNLFTKATEDTLSHLDTYPYFDNFRGTKGITVPPGSKQEAIVTRTVGRTVRSYRFKSILEARKQLNVWLTMYPIEQFNIYRVRKPKNGKEWKEKIPLLIENNLAKWKRTHDIDRHIQ